MRMRICFYPIWEKTVFFGYLKMSKVSRGGRNRG